MEHGLREIAVQLGIRRDEAERLSRLRVPPALVANEEERPVFHHRTADGGAELVLMKCRRL